MSNQRFLDRAFGRRRGPKFITGFSRPVYHNLAGLLYGHQFDKKAYGGMLRHSEAGMLYLWARALPPGATIVEIGSYGGLSTSYLAKGCREKGGRVFGIDPFDSDLKRQARLTDHAVSLENKPSREQVLARLKASGLERSVELIQAFSQDAARDWSRSIHFLWIDGNHDQAYEDYVDWSPFLAPGARVALHDAHPVYGLADVAEAARRIFTPDRWVSLEQVKSIITGIRRESSGFRRAQGARDKAQGRTGVRR